MLSHVLCVQNVAMHEALLTSVTDLIRIQSRRDDVGFVETYSFRSRN